MGDQPNPAPAGYCGLRSPPSWKPKPQREGRGGEERVGRGVESRGEQRTSMEPCSRVRVAKCQMLATSLFVLAFLSFALVFCALVQAAFWRAHSPTQVEDAVLDAYDRAYERALRSASESRRQELVAIQDTYLSGARGSCPGTGGTPSLGPVSARAPRPCGGTVPGPGGAVQAHTLPSAQDCLQRIQSFLRVHRNIVSTLIGLGLAFTVYAMLLSSFIWFTIRLGRYPVSQRARDHPPQEPRVYRCIQEGSPSPRPSKADAPGGHLSPSRRLGQLLLLQDTHPPTHGSGDATVSTRM
nr:tetraspanin-32 isoform X16 [Bubalus bubalis]